MIKLTAPGIPDFYQGTEIPALTLVDPDNRNIPDFHLIRFMLSELDHRSRSGDSYDLYHSMLKDTSNGYLKLYIIKTVLTFRTQHEDLFQSGDYTGLKIQTNNMRHWISFGRALGNRRIITLAGRFFLQDDDASKDTTTLSLPDNGDWMGTYRDILTGLTFETKADHTGGILEFPHTHKEIPAALLVRIQQ